MPLERDPDLGRLAAQVERSLERLILTRNGEPVAVVISAAELAGLEDTLEMLRNPDEASAVDQGIADIDTGRTYDQDDVLAGLPLAVATALYEHLIGPSQRTRTVSVDLCGAAGKAHCSPPRWPSADLPGRRRVPRCLHRPHRSAPRCTAEARSARCRWRAWPACRGRARRCAAGTARRSAQPPSGSTT